MKGGRARPGLRLSLGLSLALLSTASARAGHEISAMQDWASGVDELVRGPIDVANPGYGLASYGLASDALGEAEGDVFGLIGVLSLGDGGFITLAFENGIGDGPGDDFAIFENGFWTEQGLFAELAFVEVSSNGDDFARFEARSWRADPVSAGGVIDPADYENLAGNEPAGLGVGFDLAELADHPLVTAGLLDPYDIGFVRVIDVIGNGSTHDADGWPVYDPYSTPFASGGFDLDGVGVIQLPEPAMPLGLGCGVLGLQALARRRRGAS